MDKNTYAKYEEFMLSQMNDSAHDCQHVYRVLYLALEIAKSESDVDMDVLITACLLHDIGRQRQFENPLLCHAFEGGFMAYEYLIKEGWSKEKADHVKKCIASHRYRTDRLPDSIEAKILFDSDKIDVTGAMGIARTLIYKGQINESLYSLDNHGYISDGTDTTIPSFFHEYNFKLKNIYDKFFTKRGKQIATERQSAAVSFYENLLNEAKTIQEQWKTHLDDILS